MVHGGTVTSPYVYDSGADVNGKHLTGTFNFDNVTRALGNLVVHRDTGCLYIAVLIGNPNGAVVRVPASGQIPAGDTTVTAAQIAAAGQSAGITLNTIEDVLALNLTATE